MLRISSFIPHLKKWGCSDDCLDKIGTIIVGNNKEWKQNIGIGKVNNQKFVSIPYADFIFKLLYKAAEVGINVVFTEESYTLKASFLNGDEMPVYKKGKTAKKVI